MELSFARCESIVNTLPIGFYTGRRISITLDKEEKTSFYSPMEDKIVVSYPIIAARMAQVEEGKCSEEEAVRSMLYHEVSHAILTPAESLNNSFAVNCFEDERIETVLKDYYHGVNFRQQLYDVHGGHAPEAKNVESAFFNAVRFGLGTAKVQKEINRILRQYASLNRNSERYDGDNSVYEYECDISKLYNLIKKEWSASPDEFNEATNGKNGKKGTLKQIDNLQDSNGENEEQSNQDGNGEESTQQGQEGQPQKGNPRESGLSAEEIKKTVGACLSSNPDLSTAQVEKLAEFQKTVEMIIGNFNKKNKGGSGINAYSGVFNPRAVARKDYRYFERAMTTQGNNKFGTCHLNLIIDCSGSFASNVSLTNGILAVLSEIERKNRNFSMDVGFINEDFRLCENVRERKMVACGGNDIPDNMKEIMMKLQKPQTCNYNIILFDGDAICNRWGHYDGNKLFSAFDMKQTTLITDPDNEQYMNPAFTSAKVVVTTKYTKELIDHIIKALTIAFG